MPLVMISNKNRTKYKRFGIIITTFIGLEENNTEKMQQLLQAEGIEILLS